MKEKRQKVELASMDLVKASNRLDEVFIVNFNDDAWLDVPFTSDIKKMEDGVAKIDSRGGTAMRDAINLSMDYLKKEAKRQKKVLLVITDGNDNASGISLEKLVNRAQQNEVLIYAIGLLNEEERREAKSRQARSGCAGARFRRAGVLSQRRRGGRSDSPLKWRTSLRNQYTIAYSPTIQAYGWQLPPDQSDRERPRSSRGPYSHRLLCYAGHVFRQENAEPIQLMLRFLWRATRGYRLRPWRSPYLRWRIETYWGTPAG